MPELPFANSPPFANVVICAKISLIAHNGLLYLNWINKNQFLVLISNVMTVYILSPSKQNSLGSSINFKFKDGSDTTRCVNHTSNVVQLDLIVIAYQCMRLPSADRIEKCKYFLKSSA